LLSALAQWGGGLTLFLQHIDLRRLDAEKPSGYGCGIVILALAIKMLPMMLSWRAKSVSKQLDVSCRRGAQPAVKGLDLRDVEVFSAEDGSVRFYFIIRL